jgi:hypothetical protein
VPPAATAAAWNASTVARSSVANATWTAPGDAGPRVSTQKNGLPSLPKPAASWTGSSSSEIPSGASACS